MSAAAVMVDSREPEWVAGSFGGLPVAVTLLEHGDTWVACDDGSMLLVERKTGDDFLGSLRDNRLFDQIQRLTTPRLNQLLRGEKVTQFPYLVITGTFSPGTNATVYTGRETGWAWSSAWGALLTLQEMGCFVTFTPTDAEYGKTVLALANRERRETLDIFPARMPLPLDAKTHFLTGLPGIGIERAKEIMDWSGGNLAHALSGLVDPEVKAPLGGALRKSLRGFLGLAEQQTFPFVVNGDNIEILKIV